MADALGLANAIRDAVVAGFDEKRLSGNLARTTVTEVTSDGAAVRIPAPTYDMRAYGMRGVVVYDGRGSYAQELDENGSAFYVYKKDGGRVWVAPRNHVGFVVESISQGIERWLAENGIEAEVEYR